MDTRTIVLRSNNANIPDKERKLLIMPTGGQDGEPLLVAEVHHACMEREEHEAVSAELVHRWNNYPALVEALRDAEEALQGMRDHVDGKKGELSDPLGAMDDALEAVREALNTAKP